MIVDLDWLADYIREAGQPVAIEELARQAIRSLVVGGGHLPTFAAGSRYGVGDRVRLLDGSLGDVTSVHTARNVVQGAFDVVTLRLHDGGRTRLAAGVAGGPQAATPALVSDSTVEALLEDRQDEILRSLRRALSSDPRFMTLYYGGAEYGCLREFFPPMSPDVLDAALALLLDALFDQIPPARVTEPPAPIRRLVAGQPSETLFAVERLDDELLLHPDWADPARTAFDAVRALWARPSADDDPGWGSERLLNAFVQPLLRALGWSSVPLAGAQDASGVRALCPDDVAAAELYISHQAGDPWYPWVLATVQVTGWGCALDTGPTTHGTVAPAHEMVAELRSSHVRYGILTNGRLWRLCCRDANSLSRAYFEVDLGAVLDGLEAGGTLDRTRWDAFLRWWMLFRRASYTPGPDGLCLLDDLRRRRPELGRRLAELLRDRLIQTALPAIAGGFVRYRHHRLGVAAETPETLAQIREASVQLLSRLLFLLIAEARELLPRREPDYRPHSLTVQAHWAAERVRQARPFEEGTYTTPRYDLVLALLNRVAKGDAAKGLPCYGRRFFDPEASYATFLERNRLSDAALARALDALFRDIDYASLDARALLQVTSVMLGTRLGVVNAAAGEVAFTRDGGDGVRCATLPDYVVTSAVWQALDPVLEVHGRAFSEAMDDVVDIRRRLRRTLDRRRRSALYAEWEAAARTARDALLGVRIVDPAMGPGEFLLGAVDVLTDGIIARIRAYHAQHPRVSRDWNPILRLVDGLRRDLLDEAERQGVSLDPSDLTDAVLLSRLVGERAVFGVAEDALSPALIEHAMWLHTFAAGAPFSFLGHHFQVGNSLLGSSPTEIAQRWEAIEVQDQVLEAAQTLSALSERVDATPLDVRWSAAQYVKARTALAPYRTLMDAAVGATLGYGEPAGFADADVVLNTMAFPDWPDRIARLLPDGYNHRPPGQQPVHWSLVFIEVFADLASGEWREDGGFDAVIGTPPWVELDDGPLRHYYASRFGQGPADEDVHYAYLSLARQLVRPAVGYTSLVLSSRWLPALSGTA